jgi:hypothetical protein
MINRTTLAGLAAVTFVLFIASAAMGQDFGEGNAFLWTVSDIVWGGFLLCALLLIVMTVGVLVRSLARSRHSRGVSA